MQKIELGHTGEMISSMGLGTMYFGSKTDEKTAVELLDLYADHGGSFLDSANKYASWVPGFQGGESEHLIGRWLKNNGNRQNMFISSKVGFPYGDIPRSLKKEIIISECEKSLKRLGTDTIDLYFAHTYDADTPVEEIMEAFFKLKTEGKIRYAGASNYAAWQLSEANQTAGLQGWKGFTCIQQFHTYLQPALRADFGNQRILTPEIQDFCLRKKLSIIAYSPLLAGAYVRNDVPIPVQFRGKDTDYKRNTLKTLAKELSVSANAVVLAWMMQSSPAVIPLITGSSVMQLKENIQAASLNLSEEHMKILNR